MQLIGVKKLLKGRGFSILEVSIALTVIAFLIYGLLNKVKVDRDYSINVINKELMQSAKDAILTYSQINGFMPCPDTDSPPDGIENRSLTCSDVFGRLPYQDLGLPAVDAWQNSLYYSVVTNADVSAAVNNPSLPASLFNPNEIFDFNTAHLPSDGAISENGTLRICGENNNNCSDATYNLASSRDEMVELAAIAIVVSFGHNGQQVWAAIDNGVLPVNVSPMELVNTDSDRYFWRARGSYVEGTEFDDLMIWITTFDVKFAALQAGKVIGE